MAAHNARYARLQIDYTDLMNLANRSEFITIQPENAEPGWPPEKYTLTFTCAGVSGIHDNGIPKISVSHQCSLYLSREYPMKEPSLLWLTDIWHPNIDHKEPRHVCTNAVQTFFSGKPVSELVLSLAEMLQYKRYHAKMEPPFPLDLDAARWVRDVAEPQGWITPEKPIDPRPLLRQHQIVRAPADACTKKPPSGTGTPPATPKAERIRFGSMKPSDPPPAPTPPRRSGITFGAPRPGD